MPPTLDEKKGVRSWFDAPCQHQRSTQHTGRKRHERPTPTTWNGTCLKPTVSRQASAHNLLLPVSNPLGPALQTCKDWAEVYPSARCLVELLLFHLTPDPGNSKILPCCSSSSLRRCSKLLRLLWNSPHSENTKPRRPCRGRPFCLLAACRIDCGHKA